jgi:hypothetical protein
VRTLLHERQVIDRGASIEVADRIPESTEEMHGNAGLTESMRGVGSGGCTPRCACCLTSKETQQDSPMGVWGEVTG